MAFWGAGQVLDLVGEKGSEQEYPQSPQGWNPVNGNLIPLIQIAESYKKVPSNQNLVCRVIL